MRDKVLKLCRRLKKCTLDDLVSLTEEQEDIISTALALLDLKTTEVAKILHTSQSSISRHLLGEIEKPEVDIYIIEQLLGIKIEGYRFTDERVKN